MRTISFNPNVSRSEPTLRRSRAVHLRIVERIRPANDSNTGRLIQFHTHTSPRPAA
ncbi:MAG: hypothetical protein WD557_15130 [Dehalococcoidia bacterium]